MAPTFYYTPSGSSTPVSLGLGSATATPGVFTLATTVLPVGTDSVTANLPAGGNYAASISNIVTETVAQSTTPGVLTTSNATPTIGASVTLTDTIAVINGAAPPVAPTFYYTPSGSSTPVSLGLGSATATPGVFTLATTALPVGTDSVTANLPAGGNYAASTSNIVTETVAQSTTPGVLTTSNSAPTVGASVTLTDTITVVGGVAPPVAPTFYYTPSGSSTPVSLGLGAATATPGVFTLSTTALPVGTDSVTANLPAGGNYAASTSNIVTETVAQSTTPWSPHHLQRSAHRGHLHHPHRHHRRRRWRRPTRSSHLLLHPQWLLDAGLPRPRLRYRNPGRLHSGNHRTSRGH